MLCGVTSDTSARRNDEAAKYAPPEVRPTASVRQKTQANTSPREQPSNMERALLWERVQSDKDIRAARLQISVRPIAPIRLLRGPPMIPIGLGGKSLEHRASVSIV